MPSPRGDSEERGSEVRGSRQVNMGRFPTALVRRTHLLEVRDD